MLYPQDGLTALHMAVHERKVDVVKLLIEAKAHVDIPTKVHIHVISYVVYILYFQLIERRACISFKTFRLPNQAKFLAAE